MYMEIILFWIGKKRIKMGKNVVKMVMCRKCFFSRKKFSTSKMLKMWKTRRFSPWKTLIFSTLTKVINTVFHIFNNCHVEKR